MEKYTKNGDRVRVRVKFTLCPKMCVLTNKKIHINPGQGKGEWGGGGQNYLEPQNGCPSPLHNILLIGFIKVSF